MKDSKKKVHKSKSWIFLLLICVATCFMGIGFARIDILLEITGNLATEPQDNIFITDVDYVSDVSADLNNSKILSTYQTILNTDIVLSEIDVNSNITYEITVYNSTNSDYKFTKTTYMLGEDTYDNENIVFSLDDISIGDILKSKQSVSFKITFYYKDNIIPSNNQLKSLINFVFEENVELGSAGTLNVSSTNGIFGGTIAKGSVEKINFVNHESVPADASSVWDASMEGNYTITGWSVDEDQDNLYEVYIGADSGKIVFPANCNSLFYWYTNLESIKFDNIDTSQVTDMSYMFGYSYGLTELDLSNFDTSNVTTMAYMFNSLSKVTEFNLISFDTSNTTSMSYMFSGTKPRVIRLDNAIFSHLSTGYGIIPNITDPLTVVVKDSVEQNWILSKSYLGSQTEILTIEEYNAKYPNGL